VIVQAKRPRELAGVNVDSVQIDRSCDAPDPSLGGSLAGRTSRRTSRTQPRCPTATLFAIVQGACFPDLRRTSAEVLTNTDGFDGYAIGGLAVGVTRSQREGFGKS
jgi:hypothetical protein